MTNTLVKRAYKCRFYPDAEQEQLLLRTFGCVRLVWNRMLESRTTAWRTQRRSINYSESSALLTEWKKTDELAFLNEVSSVPLQQSLRHLHTAFQNFWGKQSGYPRFKSRKKSRRSAEFTASAFRFRDGNLFLAKCHNPLDIVWSRPLPAGATPTTVTVSQDRAGRWFVSLLVEEAVEHLPSSDDAVGIDMGLTHLATLSTGEKIDNPRIGRKHARRLARAQRELSRKQPGSVNREKARLKVARINAKISDTRRDHLHKLSTRLVRENQTIVIEDLGVATMSAAGGARKRGLNVSIADASWSSLRSMLDYKCHWYGRDLVIIDRWFPSTQLCSHCGAQTGPKSDLTIRVWECGGCGVVHDRDINAANNIKAAGLAVSVCGDGRSRRYAHL